MSNFKLASVEMSGSGGFDEFLGSPSNKSAAAAASFKPGDKVKIKPSHGSPKFRGDGGEVEKSVQFGKYYVELEKNGRALVDGSDMEKTASSHSMRLSSLQQLEGFVRSSSETLIHKSTRDLWALRQESGEYFIERLFQDDGSPLKG